MGKVKESGCVLECRALNKELCPVQQLCPGSNTFLFTAFCTSGGGTNGEKGS